MQSIATFDVEIQGITPLLMNSFTAINAGDDGGSALAGDKGSAREQAAAKIYRANGDPDGTIVVPQPNLLRCIIDAGKFFKSGRSKITTRDSSLIPACVEIEGIALPLIYKDPWEVDTRPVRNPATGGRFLCHRPMFREWGLKFEMRLDTQIISKKLLREIVDAAGRRIGLGDFRPDRKGPFGKFVVTKWVENENESTKPEEEPAEAVVA